jgi:hypothetical protein
MEFVSKMHAPGGDASCLGDGADLTAGRDAVETLRIWRESVESEKPTRVSKALSQVDPDALDVDVIRALLVVITEVHRRHVGGPRLEPH